MRRERRERAKMRRDGESGFLKERSWGDVDSLAQKFQVGPSFL